jgi:hypothetical protein
VTKVSGRDAVMDPEHGPAFAELTRWASLDDSAEARTFRLALNWHDNGVDGLAVALGGGKAGEDVRRDFFDRARTPEMRAHRAMREYERARGQWLRRLVSGAALLGSARTALVECTGHYVQSFGEISNRRLAEEKV